MPDPPPADPAPRPRADGWGGDDARAELRLIAEDARTRSGFNICAVEVLRNDDMLEFVAIAGSPDGEALLMRRASPLAAMKPALSLGAEYGPWTFVAAEWLTPRASQEMTTYGFVPDIAVSDDPDAWHPMDMLVARVVDDRGHLRALLYLDEPVDGRRPSPVELRTLSQEMQLVLRAVLSAIEREELAQQVRLAETTREVVRAASGRVGYLELLAQTTEHLVDGFRADDLLVHVYGDPLPEGMGGSAALVPPDLMPPIETTARSAWTRQAVIIVEPGRVWGDDELDIGYRDALTAHLASHGAGELVIVPVGSGPDPLGVLVLTRELGGARWTESESWAALDIGHDLGRALETTRAHDREQELITELQRIDDYRAELISTVSHELKNPLGVIVGHVEMLESLDDLPAPARTSLAAMTRSAARLTNVVDDLLLLSKMGNPDTPLVRESVDLRVLLADVTQDVQSLATQMQVRVRTAPALDISDGVVHGDPEELLRLMSNLVGNAVKYSREGGRVELALVRHGDQVTFTCLDDGLGISEADQAQLFSEFFRSTNPEALARPGTGLGLAIVSRIVSRHGGTIAVESALGRGTRFTVTLPVGG